MRCWTNPTRIGPAAKAQGSPWPDLKLPPGWDEEKVRPVLSYYEEQTEEEGLIEDEAAVEPSDTVMNVPRELAPAVRELIAKRRG